MARIGNEAKLILKLAKVKRVGMDYRSSEEPYGFREDSKLHEAYMYGFVQGQERYEGVLDSIVLDIEEGG